jgi:hypothetical protein
MSRFILCTLVMFSSLTICIAQSMSFSRVGSIGKFSNGVYAASLATSFNNSVNCIKLNTGVTLFGGLLGRNEFFSACTSVISNDKLEFKLFPNPVVSYGRLVGSGFSSSLQTISVDVVDASGRLMMKFQLDTRILRTGHAINMSNLFSGNYFLRVHGGDLHHVIPFIKVQ